MVQRSCGLVHPLIRVVSPLISTTIHPTAVFSHLWLYTLKTDNSLPSSSLHFSVLYIYERICPIPTQEWLRERVYDETSGSDSDNFGSITPPFSDCTSEMVQRKTSGLCHQNFDQIQTRRLVMCMLSRALRDCLKRDNFDPTWLTCVAHVKHVGSKRVTHRVPQPIT
jgi:hypothetical protein